jgi:hypothetical protein
MDTVLEIEHRMEVSAFSVDGQVVEEKDQDPSILVDVIWYHPFDKSVEVKLFGEELKHRLKGHTFFFKEKRNNDKKVRKILI